MLSVYCAPGSVLSFKCIHYLILTFCGVIFLILQLKKMKFRKDKWLSQVQKASKTSDIAGGFIVNLQYGFFTEKCCGFLLKDIAPRLVGFQSTCCLKYKKQKRWYHSQEGALKVWREEDLEVLNILSLKFCEIYKWWCPISNQIHGFRDKTFELYSL